ncbi:hypothetical protein VPH35_013555 [Triticum aestivum]
MQNTAKYSLRAGSYRCRLTSVGLIDAKFSNVSCISICILYMGFTRLCSRRIGLFHRLVRGHDLGSVCVTPSPFTTATPDIESKIHTTPTSGAPKESGPSGQDDNDEEEAVV